MNWLRSHTGLLSESDVSGASLSTIQSLTDLSGARVANDLSGAQLSTVSTTLDLSGASVDFVDDRADLIKDVSTLLSPLTADESAAIAAAKKADIDPAPANDTEVPYMLVSDLSNNEIHYDIPSWTLSRGSLLLPKETLAETKDWNVTAANDVAQQDGFSTFQSTWIDQFIASHTPTIQEKTDSYGRRFFSFDNGINNSFTAIVFEVQGKRMLMLNDVILPLEEFFSLVSCEFKGETQTKKCADLEFLEAMSKIPEHVICVFPTRTLTISKFTADKVMTVLTHLSKVYDPNAKHVKNEIVFSVEQETKPWYYGSLGVAFLSGLVYGASLVMGK